MDEMPTRYATPGDSETDSPPPADSGLTIAVLGLGFGSEFVPIYLRHPSVARVVLVEPDPARLVDVARRFAVADTYADLEAALADDTIDAVHILAPVHFHAEYAIAVLEAGKHCACAVPMATTLEDVDRIIEAERRSGKRYMMMETSVYGREYLAVEELYRRGDLGDLVLYRGFHVQNLDGYPAYWQGFPPMHYLTHALSPVLELLATRVVSVQCHGAGRLAPERRTGGFDNLFPTEVGLFTLQGSDVLADIQMSFSQTARSYLEGFSLYGDRLGIEWPVENHGPLVVHTMTAPVQGSRGNHVETALMEPRDFGERLPPELAGFVRPTDVCLPGMSESVRVGAAHSGSHPFLVDEFVRSIVEERPSHIDAIRAAEWTAPGICAHQSAMNQGTRMEVPSFPGRADHTAPTAVRRSSA